jgi:CBS domain-containing protein
MTPIYVKDVYDASHKLSVLVQTDELLENVLRRFAEEAWLRGIFVTDEAGRLMGIITRTDLLDWVRLRLGTALKATAGKPERILRLIHLVGATTARDAIHSGSERAAVRLEDPVDRALQLMLDIDLIAIPVVDNEGRILGDLTLSHVLRNLLDLGDNAGASST